MTWNDVNIHAANDFSPSNIEYAPQAISGPDISAANDFSDYSGDFVDWSGGEPSYPTIQSVYAPATPSPAPVVPTVTIQGVTIPLASLSSAVSKVSAANVPSAVGGQNVIPGADGGRTVVTKQTANSYTVMRYAEDGHLISSEVRYLDSSSVSQDAAPSTKSSASLDSLGIGAPSAAVPASKSVADVLSEMGTKSEAKETSSLSKVTMVKSTGLEEYKGSDDWRSGNESGQAQVISELDIASALGVAKIGKWLLSKTATAVVKAADDTYSYDEADDLKARLESGDLTDSEYDDLVKEYIDYSGRTTGKTTTEVLQTITDDITAITNSGGLQVADKLSKAFTNYLEEHGYVPVSGESQVKTTGLALPSWGDVADAANEHIIKPVSEAVPTLEEVTKAANDYVIDPLTGTVVSAGEALGVGSTIDRKTGVVATAGKAVVDPLTAPIPAPSKTPVSTVGTPSVSDIDKQIANADALARGESLPYPDTTRDTLTSAVVATGADTTVDISSTGGKGYPITEDEKRDAAKAYLDTKYTDQSGAGQDNELVAKYFWYLVPQMSQYGIDYKIVAESTREYESLFGESSPLLFKYVTGTERIPLTNGTKTNFDDFNVENKKKVIRGWNKELITRGVPAPIIAMFNAGLASADKGATDDPTIRNWMSTGELARDLKNDIAFNIITGAKDFLSSPAGMAAVGGGLGLLGTAGAFMVAGPIGGISAMGTLPFTVTEFIQTFGTAAWKTKGELQLQGEYSQDHATAYNAVYVAANDAIKNVGIAKSTNDPTVNLNNIESAKLALEELKKTLSDKWVYLEAANIYDSKVRQIEILEKTLETNSLMFDEIGNYIAKDLPAVEILVVNTKPEWTITYGDLKLSADGSGVLGKIDKNFTGDIVVTDSNGKEIGRQQIKTELFSGDREIDVESIVKQTGKYAKTEEEKPLKTVTVTLQPGYVATRGNMVLEGGSTGKSYDVTIPDGVPTEFIISAPDKKADKISIYYGDGQWERYLPMLEDAFKASTKAELGQGIILDVTSDSTVKINGANLDVSKDYNKKLWLDPGYYAVEIATPGKKTLQKNVYVGDDQFLTVSSPAEDAPATKVSSGGGGGGGGGGSSSTKTAAATYAMIIYGDTCQGATIYQDEIEIAPVINQIYSITPGYHSVRLVRTGKKEWLKTVYCAQGDTITVSPAFEDLTTDDDDPTDPIDDPDEPVTPVDEDKVKRVFVNSDPSGAKVLLNGSSTGEWTPCYLDLPYGYYTIGILKTGYKVVNHALYVGSIIAWDSQADYLAKLEGLI